MPDTCPAASRRPEVVQVRVIWLWVCETVESKALGQHEANSTTSTHRDGGWHLAYHVADDSRSGSTWLVRCRRRRRHLVLNLACQPDPFEFILDNGITFGGILWSHTPRLVRASTRRLQVTAWVEVLDPGELGQLLAYAAIRGLRHPRRRPAARARPAASLRANR